MADLAQLNTAFADARPDGLLLAGILLVFFVILLVGTLLSVTYRPPPFGLGRKDEEAGAGIPGERFRDGPTLADAPSVDELMAEVEAEARLRRGDVA